MEKPVDIVENLEKTGRNGKVAEKFRYMRPEELAAEIKSGGLRGAYVFLGDEDYLKRHYLSEINLIFACLWRQGCGFFRACLFAFLLPYGTGAAADGNP